VRTRGDEIVAGLRTIASAERAVLVHCTAGKDRTGIFVAVLLGALGVSDECIVRSYAESNDRLGEGFRSEVSALLGYGAGGSALAEETLDQLLASPAELIEEVLRAIRHDHGTMVAYLEAHGLSQAELADLRRKLVV
jgi:protein tyrosine/serine phosphatase